MQNLLITGGCGFIGSNFIRWALKNHPEIKISNLDALTYAGHRESVTDLEKHPHYTFVHGDILDDAVTTPLIASTDVIFHFAAETHVDRSITNPQTFFKNNILGTIHLLENVRTHNPSLRFVHISTDEVYGSISEPQTFKESSPLSPSSPYSSSKAAADFIALSYFKTFNIDVVITRTCNNFGPFQFPEKLIPVIISNALKNKSIPIYAEGLNSRDWIYVLDNASAIWNVAQYGLSGEVYNIGSNNEWKNIDLVKKLLDLLGKSHHLIEFVKDRPGHDWRYAIDSSKLQKNCHWESQYSFETALKETVHWYKANTKWVETVLKKPPSLFS